MLTLKLLAQTNYDRDCRIPSSSLRSSRLAGPLLDGKGSGRDAAVGVKQVGEGGGGGGEFGDDGGEEG